MRDKQQTKPLRGELISAAQAISIRFRDDGMCWYNSKGRWLPDVCVENGATVERAIYNDETEDWEPVYGGGTTDTAARYVFPDGSAIVTLGDAWDLEGSTPFSWRGAE